ncbi:MAG: universal stress protein A [Alphaproteobacteria bacterium]|jgi:universal stress protein A
MKKYKRIIAAIDVYSEYNQVLQSALCIANEPSQLSLVFVTLPISHFQPYISGVGIEYVTDITLQAKSRLSQIARKFDIPQNNVYAPVGEIAGEIYKLATDIKADLIVLGAHGSSGYKVLLGSVANTVLHCAKQDVLTVNSDDSRLIA